MTYRQKSMVAVFVLLIASCNNSLAYKDMVIIGGGIAGAIEAYNACLEAEAKNVDLCIKLYEQNDSITKTPSNNIVPSLTIDEIMAVVPRGPELVKKMEIKFNSPGGIRVEDVTGIEGTIVTEQFKQEVQSYSLDEKGHNQRTQDLLALGKMSMDLWQEMYHSGDAEFKEILRLSNFNRCGEPSDSERKELHDGYRIDLIYNVPNAHKRAEAMQRDYAALGYKYCTILTPEQVVAIDPFLADFCHAHSVDNEWSNDTVALWRPGGCLDAQVFLPRLYEYLKKRMGTYINAQGKQEDCFTVEYGKKVTEVECITDAAGKAVVMGLSFEDGQAFSNNLDCHYVFCPGESVGTLKKLGFSEPAYAGFAGVSLLLDIEIPQEKIDEYCTFSHCMEVHQEGVVLAWQARFKNNKIFIGVAGTKAFYADQRPTKDQEFAKNRNLLQLNMINDVLPEFISWALNRDTKGQILTQKDLDYLESQKIAKRWAGVRAVAYDGFPTLGALYKDDRRIKNARCTTHLGSGGVSFAPAATAISRSALREDVDTFSQRILQYGNSARTAQSFIHHNEG